MSDQTCTVEVRRGDTWHLERGPCGKKAKGELADGTPACGTHLNVEKRQDDGLQKRAQFNARKADIHARLGIEVWGWEIRDPIVVSVRLEDLERIVLGLAGTTPPTVATPHEPASEDEGDLRP